MTEIRKRALVGILGLVSAGLFSLGCSSSSNTTGTGGSSGSAGTSGGGGTNGSGTAGTTGGGGTTGAGGSTVACAAASPALITDFSADASAAQVGTPYKGAAASLTAPTATTATGSLVMTFATGPATATDNYAYVGLPFNHCVDATTYSGVKFNISGTLSAGCTIQFSTVDKEHSTLANGGTCDPTVVASCYASSSVFTLPATATDVTVAFASQTGGGAPAGAAVVDPSGILNVQWQVNVPTAGCTGTVTVNSVTFE